MNVAFLTEIGFRGKVPANHPNMRTEMAWMHALDATHYNVYDYHEVKGYDAVFIIFPKGTVNLNTVGSKLVDEPNTDSKLFASDIVKVLKDNNKKVCFVQEGPCWFFNDYSLVDQFNYYNQLQQCDILFAHNGHDVNWYTGLFPGKRVSTIPTLMIEDLIKDIEWKPKNTVMVGGNFCRWYGGFQSYLVASEMNAEIWLQTSHASQEGENQIPDLHVLPRLIWIDWMNVLSQFKYGVNLMPTAAAGTFSLNCAYFGIPCIGNMNMDTQRTCHTVLSIDVGDIDLARQLARRLKTEESYYKERSEYARYACRKFYNRNRFVEHVMTELS